MTHTNIHVNIILPASSIKKKEWRWEDSGARSGVDED
jgi:hypothetical protein